MRIAVPPDWPGVGQPVGLFSCTRLHSQVTSWPYQIQTGRRIRWHRRHLANDTETTTQRPQGRIRRRRMCATCSASSSWTRLEQDKGRTTLIGSCFKRRDDLMPSRCFADCTGCRSSRGSSTRRLCWRSRSGTPQHQPTSTASYRCGTVREASLV